MKKPYDLLKTPLLQRSRREWWGSPGALARNQYRLPMTAEASDINTLLAAGLRRRPYGPRKHRDRWFDMGAKLPAWVQTGAYRLTEATKAVLFTIVHDMRSDGEARVAFGAIAAYAGVSEKTVERAVKVLEDLGLIEVIRGGWSNRLNRKVMNVYRISDRRLRSWWARFFSHPTDKYGGDPLTSKIPVSTALQEKWGEPHPAQMNAAVLAVSAMGETGDPWEIARRSLLGMSFRGMGELVATHRYNALLAALQISLRLARDPNSLKSPRGYLKAILSKNPGQYHPYPSIRKEHNIRILDDR